MPGPRDLLHLGERAADAVELLLGLGPRLVAMLDEGERVLDRVDVLLDRLEESRLTADSVLGRAEDMLARVEETRSSADGLLRRTQRAVAGIDETRASAQTVLARTDAVVDRTDAVVDRAAGTLAGTDKVVGGAEGAVTDAGAMVARTGGLLDLLEPSLLKLQPVLARLAETTHPDEVDALVTLIDRMPLVTTQFEREVMPIMRTLGTVAPDVRDLLDVMAGMNEMLGSVPGLGRVKKRLDEEADDDGSSPGRAGNPLPSR